jgi:hypothetical protein
MLKFWDSFGPFVLMVIFVGGMIWLAVAGK